MAKAVWQRSATSEMALRRLPGTARASASDHPFGLLAISRVNHRDTRRLCPLQRGGHARDCVRVGENRPMRRPESGNAFEPALGGETHESFRIIAPGVHVGTEGGRGPGLHPAITGSGNHVPRRQVHHELFEY